MNQSQFLSLNWADLGKGLLVAVGTAVITSLAPVIQSGQLPDKGQLIMAGVAALGAGMSYLMKNLFTNSQNKLGIKEPK